MKTNKIWTNHETPQNIRSVVNWKPPETFIKVLRLSSQEKYFNKNSIFIWWWWWCMRRTLPLKVLVDGEGENWGLTATWSLMIKFSFLGLSLIGDGRITSLSTVLEQTESLWTEEQEPILLNHFFFLLNHHNSAYKNSTCC